ncbi:Gfo/Idh/MocA family oxidoreductase [Vibrio hepatarius]|uniref:Gfo/Idh/MocA family oxidoreductase n=1 Tax=Vibrio hepatarius TaxID=171383 RepID=UPI001C0925E6|nr:Gfo/Idh/MocA family oxidoreductase [Vibrio hepatarius]MBU2898685.1 Gfo/Idh/MocA family oxidoreductase [Vibrio hepatarius]
MNNKKKVIIVGAKFGELYLNTFIEPPDHIELVGLLSTGSQRSHNLAKAFGIPLYRQVSDLPRDIDIACVVVRASIIGGTGNLLVEELLAKGINVIQEHPVSVQEIERHHRLAKQYKRHYCVNSFYSATTAGQTWLSSADHISRNIGSPASYGNLTTSRQLLYSTLDWLVQSLDLGADVLTPELIYRQPLFDVLNLSSSSGHYLLQLQNHLDPSDPDMHSLAMHRIMLGWNSGYLSLADSYGPVTWTPVLHAKDHQKDHLSLYQTAGTPEGAYLHAQATQKIYQSNASRLDTFEVLGPEGIQTTINMFINQIDTDSLARSLSSEHQIRVAQLWEHILTLCGPVKETKLTPAKPVDLLCREEQ